MGFSKETIQSELQHVTKLQNKHRGEIAELAFMRKAAALGFSVAKPWGDNERYDVVVRAGKAFWRVQVKSTSSKSPDRKSYRINLVNWHRYAYTADQIDFLVAYIFPEDAWYVFPVSVIANRKIICLSPKSKRFGQYLEAWDLMEAPEIEPPPSEATEASL